MYLIEACKKFQILKNGSNYQGAWPPLPYCIFYLTPKLNKNIKSVTYNSQMSHTGKLYFCNWLAEAVRRNNGISITLSQVY